MRIGLNTSIVGGSLINPFAAYAIGGQTPQTIADFEADKYRADGTTSTAASLLTHTRAGTATYTDNTGTLQTAASGELRKDNHIWNGSAWVKRCLVEPQSTNLVTYSEDFTNASWSKFGTATLALDVTGPDGQANSAVTLQDSGAGGTGAVAISVNVTVSTSTAYTFSLFAKADQLSWIDLRSFNFTTGDGETYFDLGSGAIGTSAAAHSASIEDFGNGWYRCSITFTTDAVDTAGTIFVYAAEANSDRTLDLDGTSSILLYGAQLEASSVPTSYIPTAGATVTRPADALSIDSTLLPYDSTAMTIAMDGEMTYADTDVGEEIVWFKWENSTSNRVYAYLYTAVGTGSPIFRQVASGVVDQVPAVITDDYSPGINVPFNIASRNTSSDLNGAIDGTALTANTTPTALPDLSATDFQIAPKGVVNIKSLRILGGYGATDAELEAATT